MKEEILDTKHFFKSQHVPLCDLWLESCIDWFRREKSGATYSRNELRSSVYEQWLSLDLREVKVPQLRPEAMTAQKLVITTNLSLQMMSVVDISKPKQRQLQQIQKPTSLSDLIEEADETGSNNNRNGNRVLELTLTDGVTEIKAMEYKSVPVLNVNLTPGIKIRINAPVTVRRGLLMLEQHNVKLLGGEVDEISVSHSLENILARALRLPETANPNNNVVEENNRRTDMYEEELRIEAEIDMLMEAERDLTTSSPPKQTTTTTPDMSDLVEAEDDIFSSINIDEHLNAIEEQAWKTHTILELSEKIETDVDGKFKTRAKFKSVTQKLNWNETWSLQIMITDDCGDLVTSVHGDVITSLIGCSPATIVALKRGIEAKNPEATVTLMKILDGLKDRLLSLNCLMEVEICGRNATIIALL